MGQSQAKRIQFSGQFRRLLTVDNALDLIASSERGEEHNFYSVMQGSKGLVVRRVVEERAGSGCSWQMINIEKRELSGYFKRKGLAIATPVDAVGELTCSLLYILSAADRAKVDVCRVNHSSLEEVVDMTTSPTLSP